MPTLKNDCKSKKYVLVHKGFQHCPPISSSYPLPYWSLRSKGSNRRPSRLLNIWSRHQIGYLSNNWNVLTFNHHIFEVERGKTIYVSQNNGACIMEWSQGFKSGSKKQLRLQNQWILRQYPGTLETLYKNKSLHIMEIESITSMHSLVQQYQKERSSKQEVDMPQMLEK